MHCLEVMSVLDQVICYIRNINAFTGCLLEGIVNGYSDCTISFGTLYVVIDTCNM